MHRRLRAMRAVCRRWLALYLPAAAAVLAASTFVGFLLGRSVPVGALPATESPATGGVFPPLTTLDLAVNNLVAMGVLLVGAVSFGAVTLFGLVVNGLLIGAVVGVAVQQLPLPVVLALIVPHGVLEIPGLLVAAAVGLRFARLTVRYLRGLEEELVTRRALREAGWLVAVSTLLIVLGAFVEANLTIPFAEWVAGEDLGVAG